MTNKQSHNQELSIFNPLDYFRLLWLILVYPDQFTIYRETCNQRVIYIIEKWLVNTLFWLPFLIPALALGLETLPYSENALPPNTYIYISLAIIVIWLAMGWLKTNYNKTIVIWTIETTIGLSVILTIIKGISEIYRFKVIISTFLVIIVIGIIESNIKTAYFWWVSRLCFVTLIVVYILLFYICFISNIISHA
jgi:hypothetical protein